MCESRSDSRGICAFGASARGEKVGGEMRGLPGPAEASTAQFQGARRDGTGSSRRSPTRLRVWWRNRAPAWEHSSEASISGAGPCSGHAGRLRNRPKFACSFVALFQSGEHPHERQTHLILLRSRPGPRQKRLFPVLVHGPSLMRCCECGLGIGFALVEAFGGGTQSAKRSGCRVLVVSTLASS